MKNLKRQGTLELIQLFRELASARRKHMLDSTKNANRNFEKMEEIFQEIKERGREDLQVFYSLFTDPDHNISQAASALALWKENEPTAIPVLERLRELSLPFISLEAKYTLSEWKKKNSLE